MAEAMSEQMTDPRQQAYAANRRRWNDEVPHVIPTAKPWPLRRPNSFRAKPPPGTVDDDELTEL